MPQKTHSLPRAFTKEHPSMSVDATERIGILAVLLGAASISTAAFLIAAVLGLAVAGAICCGLGAWLVRFALRVNEAPREAHHFQVLNPTLTSKEHPYP